MDRTIPCPPAPKKNYNMIFDEATWRWVLIPKDPLDYLPADWDDLFEDMIVEDDFKFVYGI
jgi:hypothetical protein